MTDHNTPLTAIDYPGAWRASEIDRGSFTVNLETRHLDALDKALQIVKQKTDDAESIIRRDFLLTEIEDE